MAAESVGLLLYKRVGDEIPEFDIVLFEFDEVFPDCSPRAGADKRTVRAPDIPFRMGLLQPGAPPSVIHYEVQKNASAPKVYSVS